MIGHHHHRRFAENRIPTLNLNLLTRAVREPNSSKLFGKRFY